MNNHIDICLLLQRRKLQIKSLKHVQLQTFNRRMKNRFQRSFAVRNHEPHALNKQSICFIAFFSLLYKPSTRFRRQLKNAVKWKKINLKSIKIHMLMHLMGLTLTPTQTHDNKINIEKSLGIHLCFGFCFSFMFVFRCVSCFNGCFKHVFVIQIT